ncbi:MAG: hemolysin family protein [Methanobrevibacter sp.]|uniref:hemolysin family protein n=1 Tax=Methanobrevibacter sp. TaxID=66852 RepID=UPI0026DF1D72|nr:hemolysin family protein [Methanobrevibacter sp.]MDO5848133.1 hemolysin family protein [Methanobrevibacter sp.]
MYETIFYIIIIAILVILTGILSGAELAVVSSRKVKLQKMIKEGNKQAKIVSDLLDDSNQFLSAVQMGITLIGVLSGAFGGAALSNPLAAIIKNYVPYPGLVSILIVVVITTYFSLVIGELVPKVIALNNPEKVSVKVATAMKILTKVCGPIATFLTKSTHAVLAILRIKENPETAITEEELALMVEESRVEGNIEKEEEDIIKRVFKMDEQKVDTIMTPRNEIIWIDLEDDDEENKQKIIESKRSIFPIAKGELDDFIGVVQAKDILAVLFNERNMDLEEIVRNPIVVPENLESLELLREYKENKEYVHMSLVVDEFGSVVGLITLNDLLEGIVGDIPGIDETDDPVATQKTEDSWLIDGRYQIDRFKELFEYSKEFPDEKEDNFTTIAGFVLSFCGKIPDEGEKFNYDRFCFEIIDMDGNKIDKILVTDLGPEHKEEIQEDDENA